MPESACLLEAYQNSLAVFTPSPYKYALYADKRNLPLLSNSNRLKEFGIEEEAIGPLALFCSRPLQSQRMRRLRGLACWVWDCGDWCGGCNDGLRSIAY